MTIDDGTSATTKLMTLLNVSATKVNKRKRDTFVPAEKLNKRKSISFAEAVEVRVMDSAVEGANVQDADIENQEEDGNVQDGKDEEDEGEDAADPFEAHYGPNSAVLAAAGASSTDPKSWTSAKETLGKLGPCVISAPSTSASPQTMVKSDVLPNLRDSFTKRQQTKLTRNQAEYQNDLLSALASRKDIYITSDPIESRQTSREAVALHALNHISKKRRRVLKNNARLAEHAKSDSDASPPEDVQDQGFTRPSVLVLLPFRNSALEWSNALSACLPSSASTSSHIENHARFVSEYALPPNVTDKLASAPPGTYPADHVETFRGNVDDNFRIGVQVRGKGAKTGLRMYSEFYSSDILFASPLGLRRAIDKDKGNADYLSSIELLVIDQLDALTMQNWEHVKFVLGHLNTLPKESRDTDFSRVKPWYLDGLSASLRQTVLLSAFDTPDIRAVYNASLKNAAGKLRTRRAAPPVPVPAGLAPVLSAPSTFARFECPSPQKEADARFAHFTTVLMPQVMKSAVQSSGTVVFVPDSFDFVRVENWFRKNGSGGAGGGGAGYAVLSEYSTNADISRARLAFFKGEKPFLLISERFHFYKRYKLRGIRNILFYGPPAHAQFFTEFLSFPFLDDDVDSSEVSVRVVYCQYDVGRLERIVGSQAVVGLIRGAA